MTCWPRSASRRLASVALDDHQGVAVAVPEPEERGHVASAHDLVVDVDAGVPEVAVDRDGVRRSRAPRRCGFRPGSRRVTVRARASSRSPAVRPRSSAGRHRRGGRRRAPGRACRCRTRSPRPGRQREPSRSRPAGNGRSSCSCALSRSRDRSESGGHGAPPCVVTSYLSPDGASETDARQRPALRAPNPGRLLG